MCVFPVTNVTRYKLPMCGDGLIAGQFTCCRHNTKYRYYY
ncbi:hypothetical protein PRUB_b1007 [Pseudoalteromonas rubra]|uniref:Uncharacterized protein n=1 Tax=Pseudoalteromonas rubra TaxID=43658 RepID=A0A8T0C366_9GAMM|nr:hypothetical protein PRUB_b1007 [Pseudoalteromonas rubra]